ncbi:hypothetical protein [Piscinibacter gummiphilus]|uniref:UrcA family protein n=1 Tax=Piscinibacter gummiphilus TaxID=946333 RepID=A0ABZ0CZI8_9BURK|nr:hypothetical protein [Piscinibacter gummiphilus]WOB08591.1 hypothetical protein RXV79_00730 [Piscinibacter gummiphilus]
MRAAIVVLAMVAAWLSPAARAFEPVTADLEQRLKRTGVEAVNDHLSANAFDLALLHRDTEGCAARAVGLTVELSRGARSGTTEAHTEALRTALGRCTGLVLSLVSVAEVPKVCASVPSWTVMQTVRELRRRMRIIEADEALRNSAKGKACSAACLHELKTTRAGLQASPRGQRAR